MTNESITSFCSICSIIIEGVRKKPGKLSKIEFSRKLVMKFQGGVWCRGVRGERWGGVGVRGWVGCVGKFPRIFQENPGIFQEISENFPEISGMTGNFNMVLCSGKIKFWCTDYTKTTLRPCPIHLLKF